MADSDITYPADNIDQVVEQIVERWNNMVNNVQNTTIQLCLMIKETLKDYPEATVKEILTRVKTHKNIKRFVSIDRIWQGMRLIKAKPYLIDYHLAKNRKSLPEDKVPYIKKDGEVFWEFYFELAKQPLSNSLLIKLEQDGKDNQWSFRELRTKLRDVRDELEQPMGFEARRTEKSELIKKINSDMRFLTNENLKKILAYCESLIPT